MSNYHKIEVGNMISFKSDVEQSAEVIAIKTERRLVGDVKIYVVKAPLDGFSGNYIGRQDTAEIEEDQVFDNLDY